jgi:two-component system, NarL family, sensor kinase
VTVGNSRYHIPFGPVALALDQLWTPGLFLFVAIMLLFPDGRLLSRRSRWAMRIFWAVYAVPVAALAVAIAVALAAHPMRVDASGGLSAIDNPAGWFAVVERGAFLLLLAMALGFILRQVLSWRRSSGERRQQLKWLASGAAVTIASAIVGVVSSSNGPTSAVQEWLDNLAWFGLAALPVSVGVAILRYRLYGSSPGRWPTRS